MLYPEMTESRFVCSLDGVWNFRLDNEKGFAEKWYEKPLKDAMTMPVPASYNDLKEGVNFRDHYGWVFYQRTFALPKHLLNDQRVILRCDAVSQSARIYLNGKLVNEHKGGFLPFETDLTSTLKN